MMATATKKEFVSTTATGSLMRARREKLKLRQCKVAELIGVTAVFLGRVERGSSTLSPKRAEVTARALRLPVDDIEFALQHDQAKALKNKIKRQSR